MSAEKRFAEVADEHFDPNRLAEILYGSYAAAHQRSGEYRPDWSNLKPETRVVWQTAAREFAGSVLRQILEAAESEGYRLVDGGTEPEPVAERFGADGAYEIQHLPAVTVTTGDSERAWVAGMLEGMASMLPKVGDLNEVRGQLQGGLQDAARRLTGPTPGYSRKPITKEDLERDGVRVAHVEGAEG